MWRHLVPAGGQDPEVLRQKELRKARNKRHRDRPGLADVRGASFSWPTKVSRMARSVGASRRISHRTPCLSPKSQAKWCWQSRPARQGLRERPSCRPAWLGRDSASSRQRTPTPHALLPLPASGSERTVALAESQAAAA